MNETKEKFSNLRTWLYSTEANPALVSIPGGGYLYDPTSALREFDLDPTTRNLGKVERMANHRMKIWNWQPTVDLVS